MSELSEAEKRRILRERRQQKFSNGGASSRLNKITGQADSHLSTDSPIEMKTARSRPNSKDTTPSIPSSSDASSQMKTASSDSTSNDPQLEILKKLANADESNESTPDLFSLLRSMKSGEGDADKSTESMAPADQAMLAYHDYRVNRLKYMTMLFKWVCFLFPYTYLVTRNAKFNVSCLPESLSFLTMPSNFFMVFTSFEIVAISVYYQRLQSIEAENKINTLHSTSKIVQMVSMVPEGIIPIPNLKGKVVTALQYVDVLSTFVADICFVLVVLGLLMYI
ncbi:hypothetical protein KAFR_0L01130 [Kazachstania africana CBS 2517]|uniref:Golgi to ER traffic protein 2 n=1 Tax=Kazachstania africana (strain ATCC 22294 / BCRC 22015 / CBS 2517 / CECT 1963 / NBRC 1671 / NRRL Y-8276) TaxID=1071382 RepID=H2B271_KAZAF|nr:hypothetical protein KAFR_0L01130 [Kazachstania africana CBS 2517]CCF60721.1 hypothetical protein KAFR_0L01130 [Kazachstania africana CBS 2517]